MNLVRIGFGALSLVFCLSWATSVGAAPAMADCSWEIQPQERAGLARAGVVHCESLRKGRLWADVISKRKLSLSSERASALSSAAFLALVSDVSQWSVWAPTSVARAERLTNHQVRVVFKNGFMANGAWEGTLTEVQGVEGVELRWQLARVIDGVPSGEIFGRFSTVFDSELGWIQRWEWSVDPATPLARGTTTWLPRFVQELSYGVQRQSERMR